MTENYRGCYEYLSAQFEQVGGYDFYRELFSDNELYGVKYDDFSTSECCVSLSGRR